MTPITADSRKTAKILLDNKTAILRDWIDGLSTDTRVRNALISRAETTLHASELLDAIAKAITTGNITEIGAAEYKPCLEILTAMSVRQEAQGFTPFETAVAVTSLKEHWIPFLLEAFRTDVRELAAQTNLANRLMDTLGLHTFETMMRRREETITRQSREILEIATPIVTAWEGVLLAPLIGTLDSMRTQRVLETLLNTISQTGATFVLLDITGVPALDSKTSQHVMETASAVRLLGAQIIITGMRPVIAQTLVHLGVDLGSLVTRPSLAAGLRYAFDELELKVIRAANGGPNG